MSVSAEGALLAQQGNGSTSHPRHNIFVPLVSFTPGSSSRTRRGCSNHGTEIWARRMGSRVVTVGKIGFGMRVPSPRAPLIAKTLHDTLTRSTRLNNSTEKHSFAFVPFPNSTMSI